MFITNKKARFNYFLLETFEAGIALLGREVKAIKDGRADLSNSFARILNGEMYLVNANIPAQDTTNYNPTRTRKLLLHRKEIVSIGGRIRQEKLTIVPTKLYTKGPLIKIQLAFAKSKRKFEKKESLKKKDIERDIEKELRGDKN